MSKKLPEPDCRLGYTVNQVREIVGDRFDEFGRYMRGQTMAICDGDMYDYNLKQRVLSGCGPHGTAIYTWDVERFLSNLPALD